MSKDIQNTDESSDTHEIEKSIERFEKLNLENKEPLEEKLDELIELLESSELNSDQAQKYLLRIENSIKNQTLKSKFEKFDEIVNDENKSREKMLNEFEFLLASSDLNSEDAFKYVRKERYKIFILSILGILFIVLGLGMIIMPAPKYFELFTIYYFTRDHGITLMDVIASIITVCGIFILANSLKHLKINH